MNTNILLSFCIPTYNRRKELSTLLDSIFNQNENEFEIIISDNASIDNTEEVVLEYKRNHPNIRYIKNSENLGPDRNLLTALNEAQGAYCWILGSDDILENGSISNIKSMITEHPNIAGMSINLNYYDSNLNVLTNGNPISKMDRDFCYTNIQECFSDLGLYFGYFSGQVINNENYKEICKFIDLKQFCDGFLIVIIIGNILKKNARWLYIDKKLVGNRGDNDSVLNLYGLFHRQYMAHYIFSRNLKLLNLLEKETYDKIMNSVIKKHMFKNVLHFKAIGTSISEQLKIYWLYLFIYNKYLYFWLKIFPILFIPNLIVKLLKKIYPKK